MQTKTTMTAMLTLAAVLFVTAGVQADTYVDWATGTAYMENLGNTTSDGRNEYNQTDTQCDKIWLYAGSGSLNLVPGVPQIVLVNPLTFEVGWTGDMTEDETKTNNYNITRDITINGVTKSLVSPITHIVTYYQDSLLFNAGAPVAFGDIIVTPLGWNTDFFTDSAGTYSQTVPNWHTISPVYAEFLLIEAPATITIETVTVGNADNTADATGYGAVGYNYRIGKYEVTAGQYTAFLNSKARTDTYGLYNTVMAGELGCQITRSGSDGSYTYSVAPESANRPVNWVSFWDACRFANWLGNGQGNGDTETGAYTLGGYNDNDGRTIQRNTRNAGWTWAVTSEDEWYKAAYYNPAAHNYFLYPTGSNTAPGRDMADPIPGNNANHFGEGDPFPIDSNTYYTTIAGEFENSMSAYGTFDQGGNVWEWNETITEQGEGSASRRLRGGSFMMDSEYLLASFAGGSREPTAEDADFGFRVSKLIADMSVTLVPERLNVTRGSSVGVSVDITLLSPITLAAISTNILYDTSVFIYDTSSAVTKGGLLTHDWDLYGNEFAAGHSRVGGIDLNPDPWYESLATGTGTLLTFTLKVKETAPFGPSALTWGVYDGNDNGTAGFDYGDADFNDVILPESALSGASITVIAEIPTAITLASFEAKPGSNSVTLVWTTETEIDNAGFNILRAEAANGQYVKINDAIIPTKAGSTQGASYQFVDSTAKNRTTYYYKLQDIGLDGSTTDHGPKSATPRLIFMFGK
jgi:formylglycine-generating enzyme